MTNFWLAFVLGFVVGFTTTNLINLLIYLCIGYLAVLAIDVALGLGARACAFRSWFRRPRHSGNVVPFRG